MSVVHREARRLPEQTNLGHLVRHISGPHTLANQTPHHPPPSTKYQHPATRMADDVSRVKYSCSQVAETAGDETKQLDFYFLYKIDAEADAKPGELVNRLQVAYVYNLASKLLPCAGDDEPDNKRKSNDGPFTVVAVDSAKHDELLEIGEACKSMINYEDAL